VIKNSRGHQVAGPTQLGINGNSFQGKLPRISIAWLKTVKRGGFAMNRHVQVEICVGDVASAIAAESGGADRVELCDNLAVGGTTPSAGTIAESCRRLSIPVHVLIRPRAGDFIYSEPEIAVMRHDIAIAKSLGAAGVVLGVLTPFGSIDRELTAALIALARPLHVTFHKAFDQTHEPMQALDNLIALGVERVLTSGGRPTALEGIEALAKLVDRAGDRIAVMAGGRLSTSNLEAVIRQSRVNEVHLGSAASRTIEGSTHTRPRDGSETSWNCTDQKRVADVVTVVQSING
jgi:copper homeostasis protein